jgi:hypothetical protein
VAAIQLSTYHRIVPVVAGLLLLLAACGGSDNNSGSSGGTKSFTVGFTSLGMSSAPFLAALDQLRGIRTCGESSVSRLLLGIRWTDV